MLSYTGMLALLLIHGNVMLPYVSSQNANQSSLSLPNADSTCRISRKKADEDQLQPTVRNTLRKLSRPTNKNWCVPDFKEL
ncbi:hypothetical protein DPX16_1306 [Anabarilius grahami]|uniref:Secreted protein n=1 Tax=Anabarilius grahami TaxID=495550 RepID=A0A3N0Y7Y4_ANAGA|nr:hypothetical protein DPX16_1306 [Anabarilius grahami]